MSDYRHAKFVMNEVFAQVGENSISDIQVRSDRLVYTHTKKGLEIIYSLGELPGEIVMELLELLYSKQEVSRFSNAESKLQEQIPLMERLGEFKVVDFSCEGQELPNGQVSGRMRVQAHLSSSGLGVTCRVLNDEIADLDQLGISPDTVRALRGFLCKRQGMGLVTGQTGSGKSTTLAAILDWLRCNQPRHIVTVEDPIEYRYSYDMANPDNPKERVAAPGFVTQQEIGKHVNSYNQGLKDVLRKAPHVILIGEVRDRATMEVCIEAAQTGHVVITTLHTNGAVKTLSRILEFFPNDQHRAVLGRMSEILMFILSQGLITGLSGRVLNYEFLQNVDSSTRSGIAAYDGGAKSLEDVIRQSGNVEWDANLRTLYERKLISHDAFQMNRMNDDDEDAGLFVPATAV